MSKEAKILIGIAIAVIIGGVLLSLLANPQPKPPGEAIDEQALIRDNNYIIGSRDAKVKVVEFGDFECPACAQSAPAVKQILANYSNNPDVAFVYKHYPLNSIHPNAQIAAEAAEAAGEQGKFWEMHDILFERQKTWSGVTAPIEIFAGYAMELGLNVDEFRASVNQRRYTDVINTDLKDGEGAGVSGTPSFYVNGVKISGVSDLQARIDEALTASPADAPVESSETTDPQTQVPEAVIPEEQPSTEQPVAQ